MNDEIAHEKVVEFAFEMRSDVDRLTGVAKNDGRRAVQTNALSPQQEIREDGLQRTRRRGCLDRMDRSMIIDKGSS